MGVPLNIQHQRVATFQVSPKMGVESWGKGGQRVGKGGGGFEGLENGVF